MTEPEFLEKLAQTPRDWFLTQYSEIRRYCDTASSRRQCPITAVAGIPGTSACAGAELLALEPKLRHDIVWAADYRSEHNPSLRLALLQACGLQTS